MNGFVVVDAEGEFLSWSPCVLVALRRFREVAAALRVERCSDGAVISTRYRRRRRVAA